MSSSKCNLIINPSWSQESETLHLCYLQPNWAAEDASWIIHSLKKETTYPIANLAIQTLASAAYGQWNRQTSVIAKAESLYAKALQALRMALSDNKRRCTFDALASISALQRYETLVFATSTGWIHHAGGVAHAIEVSSPEWFNRFPYKTILDANVYHVIHESQHHRKRPFLALEQWRYFPTLDDEEGHFDHLQSLYARSAGVAASFASFIDDQSSETYLESLLEADKLLKDLEIWITTWISCFNHHSVERLSSSSSDTPGVFDRGYYFIFGSYLHYSSRLAGLGANIYRTIKITTLVYREYLQHYFWTPGEPHPELHKVSNIRQLALDICCTLHFHFSGSNLYYVWFLLFSSSCAYRGLLHRSREAQWISVTLVETSH